MTHHRLRVTQSHSVFEPEYCLKLALSGSGNSENVIRAVKYANDHGATTLGLCGYRGGKLKETAQHVIWVDADDMQLSEDVHFFFGHIVMQRLCAKTA